MMTLRRFACAALPFVLLLSACGEGGADASGGGGSTATGCGEAPATSVGGAGGGATTGASATTVTASASASATSTGQGGLGTASSSVGSGGATTGSGGAPGEGRLVINEISASGDDWIELFNAGDAELDLSGLRVADQESAGVPKLAEAVTIPLGTTLDAGDYLFILAGQGTPDEGFTESCTPGPAPCLQAAFGLSQGNGDEIFVVDEADGVLLSEAYPADAAPTGSAWGRLPNGTGDFAETGPTPGAANEAP